MKHLAFALAAVLALGTACGSSHTESARPAEPAAASFTPTAFGVQVSGSGRPVLFIPGLASSGHVWDGTVAHLGGKVQAHVLTLAGFAGQPPLPPGTPFLATVHDQILQYIAANHLEKPIIVGHSLGGAMTIWLAETAPNLGGIVDVDGLPFLGGMQDPNTTEAQAAAAGKAMHDQLAKLTQAQLGEQMRGFLAQMITSPADVDRVATESAKSDVETVATAFAELMGKDMRADLPKIAVPVTVVAATGGGVPRAELEKGWHAQVDPIKGAQLVFVDDARHFVMLDQPDKFYAIVDQALAK